MRNILRENYVYSIFSIAVTLACFTLHYYILHTGHLHEDAYILFEYVKHISNGDGIVYYQGGERAEGATDFLWLICLSALHFVAKLDIGLAAALLNSLGAGLIMYVCMRAMQVQQSASHLLLVALFAAVIIMSPLTSASLGGFSTLLYVSVSMLLVHLYWHKNLKNYLYIPLVAIVLALIRPDGVIIGVVFCLLALHDLKRSKLLRPYLMYLCIAGLIGVTYFVWRYLYFGHLLPLPLYVKVANSGSFPGLEANFSWLKKGYIRLLLLSFLLLFILSDKRRKVLLLKASLPYVFLLLFLSLSHQSQNIANRFQGPVLGLLLFTFAVSIGCILNRYSIKRFLFVLLTLLALLSTLQSRFVKEVTYLQSKEYINYFPLLLAEHTNSETVIALTEAGRMAFWNDAKTYDLVGLNTVHTAIYGVDINYLTGLNADLMFIHTAGVLKPFKDPSAKWIVINAEKMRTLFKGNGKDIEYLQYDPVKKAALISLVFISGQPQNWKVYAVKYGGEYTHIYAVNKLGSINVKNFEDALNKSFEEQYQQSYLLIKGMQ